MNPSFRGSRLDADHPEKGVLFARQFTTAALLNNIATPGLDIKDMFFRVGREVIATTRGAQRPEISVSFYDSYALAPASPPAVITPPVASAPPNSAAPTKERCLVADPTGTPFNRVGGRPCDGGISVWAVPAHSENVAAE